MAIALNAGSNPNGQAPSVGAYGDGNGDKNSLLGNFGDLLTLISVDAENALHENTFTPKMTPEKTGEALLAFAETGNDDAKLAISTILQRVNPENSNQLSLNESIPTSSFLEAKIENRLGQQNLLKPAKVLEFLSVADLKAFIDEFVTTIDEFVITNDENFLETALSTKNNDALIEHDINPELSLVKTTDSIGNTVAVTTTGPTGDDPFAISIANAGSIALPKPLELVSDNDGINVPLLPEIIEKNLKADSNSFNE